GGGQVVGARSCSRRGRGAVSNLVMTQRPRRAETLSVSLEVPPAERAAVWAACETDAARLIRVRVLLAVGIYTVFVGLAVLLERAYHPERGNSLLHIFFVEMGICAVAV